MKIIDYKKPITGRVLGKTDHDQYRVLWHNGIISLVQRKDRKEKYKGSYRYALRVD